jgi:hypothetical protein
VSNAVEPLDRHSALDLFPDFDGQFASWPSVEIAEATGLIRTSLYEALSQDGNPEFAASSR